MKDVDNSIDKIEQRVTALESKMSEYQLEQIRTRKQKILLGFVYDSGSDKTTLTNF